MFFFLTLQESCAVPPSKFELMLLLNSSSWCVWLFWRGGKDSKKIHVVIKSILSSSSNNSFHFMGHGLKLMIRLPALCYWSNLSSLSNLLWYTFMMCWNKFSMIRSVDWKWTQAASRIKINFLKNLSENWKLHLSNDENQLM